LPRLVKLKHEMRHNW